MDLCLRGVPTTTVNQEYCTICVLFVCLESHATTGERLTTRAESYHLHGNDTNGYHTECPLRESEFSSSHYKVTTKASLLKSPLVPARFQPGLPD